MILKFSERIRELRKECKKTQADVAKEMNVTQATVTRWELGIQEPDYATLIKLSNYYKVSSDYLLGLED